MDEPSYQIQQANNRFYQALANCSIKAMDEIWLHSDHAVCIHPGWTPLKGWSDIRASWVNIFRNTQMHKIKTEIFSSNVIEKLGWISCFEQIGVIVGNEMASGYAFTTNIFTLTDDGWKIVVHHGLPTANQTA